MFASSPRQRAASIAAALSLLLSLVHVGPIAPVAEAASPRTGDSAGAFTLCTTTTTGTKCADVTSKTKTVNVGDVFRIDTVLDTDGASTNSFQFLVDYPKATFQAVDSAGVALANDTSLPTGQVGSVMGTTPTVTSRVCTISSAGCTGSYATNGQVSFSMGNTATDTDQQIYSPTDDATQAAFVGGASFAGPDVPVTLYFRALAATGVVSSDNIFFNTAAGANRMVRTGDWSDVTTQELYISTDSAISAGDTRLTDVAAYTAGSVVALGDTDIAGPGTITTLASGASVTGADATFTLGADAVYLNLDYARTNTGTPANVNNVVVSVGDVRVIPPPASAYTAGSTVALGDTDVGVTLNHLANARIVSVVTPSPYVVCTAAGGSICPTPAVGTTNGARITVDAAVTHTIAGTITGTTGVVALGVTPSGSTTSTGGATNTYVTAGLADGTYTITPTLAGCTFSPTNRTPTLAGVNITGQDFTATCSPTVSPSNSLVSASPTCVVSPGNSSLVTVYVRDGSNNPISGASVTLSTPTSGVTVATSPQTSNASGAAYFTVSASSAVGSATFTATANAGAGAVTITQTAAVTFATTCGATTNVITLSPACVVLNASTSVSTSHTLQVRTSGGASVPTTAVSAISINSGTPSMTVSPTSGTTDSVGNLALTLTTAASSTPQTRTLSATVSGTVLTTTVQLYAPGTSGCGTSGTGALANSTKTDSGDLNNEEVYDPGDSIDFTIAAINNTSTALTDVSVLDSKDKGWNSFATGSIAISPISGTNNSTSSQLSISGMSVAANGTTSIAYTQKLKSGSDFVDDMGLDSAADPKVDGDFWADDIVDSNAEDSGDYDSEDDVTGAPDGVWFALGGSADPVTDDTVTKSELDNGDTSYIIVDFADTVVVNTSGDDFIVMTKTLASDTKNSKKEYAVYASQDGYTFSLVKKGNTTSATFDLGKSDYDWASQIAIVDETDDSDAAGDSPGIGIDAIGMIHLGARVRNTATLTSAAANSTANPSDTITVDMTSVMDNELNPDDFLGTTFSSVNSTTSGDPCATIKDGETLGFTLRDSSNNVVPNQLITIAANPNTNVTVSPLTATTDASGRISVKVMSSKEQSVTFSFQATPSGSTTSQTVLTYTVNFKTSCAATLPRTGSGTALWLGALGIAALPAAWVARRRRHEEVV